MRRSPLLLVVLVWLVAGAVEAADYGVDVLDNRFEPATITIAPGDRVTWTNRGQNPHTVTADNGSFNSERNEPFITPVRPFTQTFEQPGRYPYHCEVHEAQGMKGVVIVRRASATSTTSSTTTTTRPSRTTSTLEPGGSAITAPGETTTTTGATTTTVEQTTTTDDTGLAAAGDLGDDGDETSTGLAAALASLLLLGVSGGTLFLMRKGELA